MKKATRSRRLKPPEDLDGEQLLEWERIVAELTAVGHCHPSYRAILVDYVTVWAAHHEAARVVAKEGTVLKYSTGVVGRSPHYQVMREMGDRLRVLLGDLGLTPAARGMKSDDDEPGDLEI